MKVAEMVRSLDSAPRLLGCESHFMHFRAVWGWASYFHFDALVLSVKRCWNSIILILILWHDMHVNTYKSFNSAWLGLLFLFEFCAQHAVQWYRRRVRHSPRSCSRTIRECFPVEMKFKWNFDVICWNYIHMWWWKSMGQHVQAKREEKPLRKILGEVDE